VRRVAADAAANTYAAIHLHFASPTPRSLLEELASETVKADCMGKLACVFDEYLDFLTLERGMFSLGMPKTYVRLNDPSAKDTDVEVRAARPLLPALPALARSITRRCPAPAASDAVATPRWAADAHNSHSSAWRTQHTSTYMIRQTDDGGGDDGRAGCDRQR
jgi:hypothetical protein